MSFSAITMAFQPFLLLVALLASTGDATTTFPTSPRNVTYALPAIVVHDFPPATWIENLAVRENGQILVTEVTRPRIYQVDPFGARQPVLVHEFHNISSVLGIVETSPDIFFVSTANLSSDFATSYGGAYVYRIDMRPFVPEQPLSAGVTKLTTIPDGGSLNGLAYLGDGTNTLVSADTLRGVLRSIDINTGEFAVVLNNNLTGPTGINGLKVRGDYVYFSNQNKGLLARVAVDSKGRPKGPTTIITDDIHPDDFALNAEGDAYVANYAGENGVAFVPREGGAATMIAGTAGPTSCAFGRTAEDCHTLYVSTSGGDEAYMEGHADSVNGKIIRIEVGRQGTFQCRRSCNGAGDEEGKYASEFREADAL